MSISSYSQSDKEALASALGRAAKMVDAESNATATDQKVGYVWFNSSRKGKRYDYFKICIPSLFIWDWKTSSTVTLPIFRAIGSAIEEFQFHLSLGFKLTLYIPHQVTVQYLARWGNFQYEYMNRREMKPIILRMLNNELPYCY